MSQQQSKEALRDAFKTLADVIRRINESLAASFDRIATQIYLNTEAGLTRLEKELPAILKKLTTADTHDDGYDIFFEGYKSPKGEVLSAESISKLVKLVRKLPSGESAEKFLTGFERDYKDAVSSFWIPYLPPGDSSNASIMLYLSRSFAKPPSKTDEALPYIRRRIGLVVLSELVNIEAASHYKATQLGPGQTYEKAALNSLLDRLWPTSEKKTDLERKRFFAQVRAGKRWARLEAGALPGLANVKSWTLYIMPPNVIIFTANVRYSWEKDMDDLEYKALIAFVKSRPWYPLWLRLSPLVSKLKDFFKEYLTGANKNTIHHISGKRKRRNDNEGYNLQNKQQQRELHVPPDGFPQGGGLSHQQSRSQPYLVQDNPQTLAAIAITEVGVSSEPPQRPDGNSFGTQDITLPVEDSNAPSSSQWTEHNTDSLGASQSFGPSTSVPPVDCSTGNLISMNRAATEGSSASFNSSYAQGDSQAMFLDSENNTQRSNLQPLNHAQEPTQSFCNAISQAGNLFFDPGNYTQQETGQFYSTASQAGNLSFNPGFSTQQETGQFYNTASQAGNLSFDPGTYTQQETGPFYTTTSGAGNLSFDPGTYTQQEAGSFYTTTSQSGNQSFNTRTYPTASSLTQE